MSICSITFAEDKIEVERDSLAPVLVAKDTVKSSEENPLIRQSLFIVPMGYYKEETSVALGVVGGYYLKSNSLSKISSLGGSIVYTFRNQFMANLTPKFYTKNERFFFTGNINIRYYPDFYIKSENKIIEVKSKWTFEKWKEKNLAKERACIEQNFLFKMIVL